ncbi:DEAD/DEAH box helicase family protein [Desulfobulbus sp.]|uniref:type I restriction endonuclease subunit R n=1 Tax=Desulfobulbus sp. TaxID=895 RepID=UPI00286F4E1E|nr:DEAD/DEAH box helicase family protein [Desulfobulbus sp.]
MSLHNELHFEREICEHLAAHDWLYQEGDAQNYARESALYLPDVQAWIEASQPEAWQGLCKTHGANVQKVLAERLRKSLNDRGAIDVLRRGVDVLGVKHVLAMAQFKPAHSLNASILARYQANRLRVVRQVHHSVNNSQDAIDLVLFLNGIPVATAELKSDFTQCVADAVDQYRFDRHPAPKGGQTEPLLSFPGGALVHFAVSQTEVMMTTRLTGSSTRFLPFNKGNRGAAGNPPNPKGFTTSYLWEEVWQRESWLEILGRYLIGKRDNKKNLTTVIFPRYHQLDATRKIVAQVQAEGPGGRFLIQHSAGSGKTNSIAWTAHFLADLHDANSEKMFDSVVVVSDRQVLDKQLQEAIFDFERTAGVVETITSEHGSKSSQLSDALKSGKKIIVCTIQTFPFALEMVQSLSATEGKRFAVIADEAHSSQTGEASAKLRQVLSAEELADIADGGTVSAEDILASQMEARAATDTITYVAFTATPKGKTLQLFGRKPRPDAVPKAFHVYSMRQAIEENFILDVLKNYTGYRLAFRLAHNGQEWDEQKVEQSEAVKHIMRWVRLHPYNIAQKVKIVVEHYREHVQPLLRGDAKAMVVVSSRKEAVRWQKALRAYIKDMGYALGALVAFSGEVFDAESFPEAVSEHSKLLNPGLNGRDIRDAFAGPEYHILLVANKFQTGFDQPLLCGMYVDKKLSGLQAVQTLSRLNRAYPGKDTTYILDFVNNEVEVLTAFKTYYETAELESETDPNRVFDLRAKLDATGYYDEYEVERVVQAEMNPRAKQRDLAAAIFPVADRLLKLYKAALDAYRTAVEQGRTEEAAREKETMDALTLFKGDLGSFNRLYSFLSQIFDYGNTAIEKRHIFYRRLLPLLDFGRERDSVDLSKVTLTHYNLKSSGTKQLVLGEGDAPKLPPVGETGTGSVQEKQKALLEEIIERVNSLFEGELTDDDQLIYVNGVIKGKLLENQLLRNQAANNSKEQFSNSPDLTRALLEAIMDAYEAHTTMSTQALNSERIRDGLKHILLGPAQLYEALREKATEERG